MTDGRRLAANPTARRAAFGRHGETVRTAPSEISEHAFHAVLNAGAPVDWRNTAHGESFKRAQDATTAIAAIYVRINDRHFRFDDDIALAHDQCCRRVALSRAYAHPEESMAR